MSSRWEPFDQLTSLRDAMSRLMDQSFIFSGRGQAEGSAQSIPVNVFETDEVLMVVAPVPGLQQEDIEITARGNTLTIEGRERADLKPESPKRYLRHEWRYGPYHRMVELPYAVDPSTAEATMGNGVLTIRLTKAATERSHKISVKTGA
jgi:HSP20 family protein